MNLAHSACSHISGEMSNRFDQSDMVKVVLYITETKVQAITKVNPIRPRYANDMWRPCRRMGKPVIDMSDINEQNHIRLSGVIGDGMHGKFCVGTWETQQHSALMVIESTKACPIEQDNQVYKARPKWPEMCWLGVGCAHSSNEQANHLGAKERNFGQVSINKGETD